MSNPWFAPKRYGYGATPNTWQGWLVSILFICIVTVVMRQSHEWGRPVTLGLFVVLTAGFIFLVHKKTSGPWRFRRGEED